MSMTVFYEMHLTQSSSGIHYAHLSYGRVINESVRKVCVVAHYVVKVVYIKATNLTDKMTPLRLS